MSDFATASPVAPLFPGAAPPPALLAPLLGREPEVVAARAHLEGGARLLTLGGPGGVGKTTLAQHLAGTWSGEACWVECARLTRADELPAHLLTSLGLSLALDTPPLEVLRAHVPPDGPPDGPPVLIVLDNLEQIEDAALAVRGLLDLSPRLRFLVTGRVPLRLRDEHLVPLSGLTPPDLLVDPDLLALNDAVMLFVRAARAVRPDFDLTPVDAPGVARLCVRLDGLPLALELAARHMDVLSPGALLGLLERHGTLPLEGELDRPERHRSLEALLDSTYTLLSEEERRVFRLLAVFGTPFDADDVRSVLGASGHGGEALGSLLKFARQGLVRSSVDGERVTFRMLETLRADAWHRLSRAGEREAALEAHAGHFRRLVVDTSGMMLFHERYHLVHGRYDDVLRALEWFLARPANDGEASRAALAMVRVVQIAWSLKGQLREGEAVVRRALARPGAFRVERSGAVLALAVLLSQMGHHEEAVSLAESVEADLYRLPDPILRDLSLNSFAVVFTMAEDFGRAVRVWKDVIAFKVREGLPEERIDNDRSNMATVLGLLGEHEEARARFLDLLERFRPRGDLLVTLKALFGLSEACLHLGRLDEAERAALEVRDLAEREGLHPLRINAEARRCAVLARRGPDEATVEVLRGLIHELDDLGYGVEAAEYTVALGLTLLFLGRAQDALAAMERMGGSSTGPQRFSEQVLREKVALLRGLGSLALRRTEEARGYFETALTDNLRRTRPLEYAAGLLGRATVHDTFGDAAGASRLRAEYRALLAERRLTPWPALSAWPVLHPTPRTGDGASGPNEEARPAVPAPLALSARELDVLARLARGDTNKQIGRALGVSENTVRAHLRSVSQKLGEHTRTGIFAHAARLGLVLAPEAEPEA